MTEETTAGISGMSVYVPPLRVSLERWCEWTGNSWDKVGAVVGRSFRCAAPQENVYTMAATAALRLIRQYGVDPREVGFFALGTESSTDNAAGAVIVRGMLDRELERASLPRLARTCEVPEFKHACLGGIYALKGAVRYVNGDGRGRSAIVVCADIAEYERGSSGEPTQGAGAVAMLVERDARLLRADLSCAGSASDYRGPDFRKPMARHFRDGYATGAERFHDFPVFSGRYSTHAYLDEIAHAVDGMTARLGTSALELFQDARAVFFHRPYHLMPIQAMAFLYVRALAQLSHHEEIASLCDAAGVNLEALRAEAQSSPDLFAHVLEHVGSTECSEIGHNATPDPYPATSALAGHFRRSERFTAFLADKMALGSEAAKDVGNLYTAALPAWLAAGLEEAANTDVSLDGHTLLAIAYGSGDAAEAIPFEVPAGWQEAAARIGFRDALAHAVDLSRSEYEALHDRGVIDANYSARDRFVISRVGERYEAAFQDLGVEYYEYLR